MGLSSINLLSFLQLDIVRIYSDGSSRNRRCGAAENVGDVQGNSDGVGALRCLIFFSSLLVSFFFLCFDIFRTYVCMYVGKLF